MSLVPRLLDEFLDDFRRPASLFDQHFGMGLLRDDLLNSSLVAPLYPRFLRPWQDRGLFQSALSDVQSDQEGFKVNVDVQQFKPDELTVKTVDDSIIVEGKHEERKDEHGYISRQFQRRYKLPEGVDLNAVQSQLSSDGVLTVAVPKKALPDAREKVVPITHTQVPAVKDVSQEKKQSEQGKMQS